MCGIWEDKEGLSNEEFQKSIDVPSDQGFGIDALMNIYKPIGTSLTKGKILFQELFHKYLSYIF